MRPVIAIRPEPGLARTIAAGALRNLDIEGTPLFEVRPLAWEPAPAGAFDALLAGSANVFRHAGEALARYRALPVHAVGEETARAAREAGFAVARTGAGGLQALLDAPPASGDEAPRRYLRLAGRAHVPLTAPAGTTIATSIVYEAAALELPFALAAKLSEGALVLLHSAEAARHLAQECDRLGVPRAKVALAALGPRIAEAAGGGWAALASAPEPHESALLALAQDMCH